MLGPNELPTVRIVRDNAPLCTHERPPYKTINKSDFDPARHTLYAEGAAPVAKPKPAPVLIEVPPPDEVIAKTEETAGETPAEQPYAGLGWKAGARGWGELVSLETRRKVRGTPKVRRQDALDGGAQLVEG